MTNKTMITGFLRIGENRELKKALESFWAGKTDVAHIENIGANLRKKHWLEQKNRGIDYISCNDFSFYDNMLDTVIMLNAIPERFCGIANKMERYFGMARGTTNAPAMAMTKWFNTNYHYIVPELSSDMEFGLNAEKIIREYKEAKAIGIQPKINIIGPFTFTGLSQTDDGQSPFVYLEKILRVYRELLPTLQSLDDTIVVQFDEPIFVKGLPDIDNSLIQKVYNELAHVGDRSKIIVTTYFEHAHEAIAELVQTKVWGIGLDFVQGSKNWQSLDLLKDKMLIAGVVSGRDIWMNDFENTLALLKKISEEVSKERIIISTSCSLLHVPYSLQKEPASEIKERMAFAVEKLDEVVLLGKMFWQEKLSSQEIERWNANKKILHDKKYLEKITNPQVAERLHNIKSLARKGNFGERIKIQKEKLQLPDFPTTTIGSFPQTAEIRTLRRDFKKRQISLDTYKAEIKKYIDECVAVQEDIGLDVLVHGEPERNDMVEYFGELLDGFHFTKNGWVQSYGSRCVKPPVIYADISRPRPMTVEWISYAQSKTQKIMKGMLTGPVTIINWSFVRNDIPRAVIAKQIALALNDEIADLQNAGIKIIQVDEAAFKEGYPLRKENIPAYEKWAVDAFKQAVASAEPQTQIHTHMCYSNFNDIMPTIEAMDADVITVETARSGNRLLRIFQTTGYKNEIGPGVYDIHSPRIPSVNEFKEQIEERLQVVHKEKMWVNPDCGLKTRNWKEVIPALKNMVQATWEIRK